MATQNVSILHTNKSNNLATKRVFDSLCHREDVGTIWSLIQEGVDMEARDSRGRTLLLSACSRVRKEIVELLIKAGANVNDKSYVKQYTVLHYASRHGWAEIVQFLVNKVFDINAMDVRGETAIHHASKSGRLKVVKCLLEKGVLLDQKNLLGFTPLMNAAQFSRRRIFDLLLESGASVDGDERVLMYFASRNRWTDTVQFLLKRVCDRNDSYVMSEIALDITSSREHLQVVKFLLEEETDIENRGNEIIRQEALYHASYMGHLEVVKWLVKEGGDMKRLPDLNLRNKSGYTALYFASGNGHLEVVKWLVEKGSDINAAARSRDTALHVASSGGHLEVVKWLVEQGSDINARDRKGGTALQGASGEGRLEIVKYLVGQGAVINTRDSEGCSPLHIASICGKLEVVKWLAEKEADMEGVSVLNAKSKCGCTALYFASSMGNLETVKCLVEKGAEINVKNISDESPLFIAAVENNKDVVDFLLSSGALDGSREQKMTVLHYAAANGWIETVQSLIKAGCDLEARDENAMTSLQHACMTGELAVVQILLQAGARWDTAYLNCFYPTKEIKSELIKLFIQNGAYIKRDDYDDMVKSSSLSVLQDAKLCVLAILNKFNNHDLPELYTLPVSERLPCIEKMKIVSGSKTVQMIERNVEFEIQANGHCNVLELRPKALRVLSVGCILEYYKKKASELKNRLNAFDYVMMTDVRVNQYKLS